MLRRDRDKDADNYFSNFVFLTNCCHVKIMLTWSMISAKGAVLAYEEGGRIDSKNKWARGEHKAGAVPEYSWNNRKIYPKFILRSETFWPTGGNK